MSIPTSSGEAVPLCVPEMSRQLDDSQILTSTGNDSILNLDDSGTPDLLSSIHHPPPMYKFLHKASIGRITSTPSSTSSTPPLDNNNGAKDFNLNSTFNNDVPPAFNIPPVNLTFDVDKESVVLPENVITKMNGTFEVPIKGKVDKENNAKYAILSDNDCETKLNIAAPSRP
jgi:hypothetical protein